MSVRDSIELGLYHLADRLIARVSLERARSTVAAAARRLFDTQYKNARWALANLRIAYPAWTEEQRRELGRESYVHFGWNLLDYIRSAHWSDEEVLEHCPLEGVEHVEKALERGRGALLLTLHMGAWEVGVQAIALGLSAHRPAVVGRPMRNQKIYRRVVGTRARGGAEVIDRRRAATSILRALRGGRPVGILLDQYSRRARGVFVPLFGVRCSTSAGLATLALRTDAPVVPCYVLRSGPDRHRGIFLPEVEIPPRTGDRKRDIEAATACYNAALEEIIRANPEQWMWGHRRFRNSPDLSEDPYV